MRFALYAFSAAAAAMLVAAPANAEVKIKLEEVAGGLTHPLAMVSIPDGSGRKAVIEQHGVVRIIDARGRLLPEPFLNIQAKIPQLHPFFDERGLLGIAFHPNYRENGKFYIAYSAPLRGDAILDKKLWFSHTNTVSEMTVAKDNPNKANPSVEKIISQIDWPQFNHNGHWIGFGPDGKLYVSTGDGGYANDWGIGHNVTIGNGQDLMSINGKMLRLDVDKDDFVPTDNPFVGRNDALPQIWAYGLRNPWRCSFDMGGDKELFCADVQQNSIEEVDIVKKGGNYGWRRMEGDKCFDYVNPNAHPAVLRQERADRPDPGLQQLHRGTPGMLGNLDHRRLCLPRLPCAVGRQVHLRRLVEGLRRHGRPDLRRDEGRRRQVDAGKGDGAGHDHDALHAGLRPGRQGRRFRAHQHLDRSGRRA